MTKYKTIIYSTFPFEFEKDYDPDIDIEFVFNENMKQMQKEGKNSNIKSIKYIKRYFDSEDNFKYKEKIVNDSNKATEVVIELKTGTRILETPFKLYVQRDIEKEFSDEEKTADMQTLKDSLIESKEVIDFCYPEKNDIVKSMTDLLKNELNQQGR